MADAVAVVKELLRASEEQIRKNALTALAAFGTEPAVNELVAIALQDESEKVRQHAQREITSLTGSAALIATNSLTTALQDKTARGSAYAILGKLGGPAVFQAVRRLPLGLRLHLARQLHSRLFLEKGWRFRVRGAKPSFWGSALGGVLFAGVCWLLHISYEILILSVIGVICGIYFGSWASQRAVPISVQPDRRIHLVIESLMVGAAAAVGGLAFLVVMLFVGFLAYSFLPFVFYLLLPTIPSVALIRAATIAASNIVQNRVLDRVLRLAFGATAGMVIWLLASSFGGPGQSGFLGSVFTDVIGSSGHSILETAIAIGLPTSLGIAWAFVTVDLDAAGFDRPAGKASAIAHAD